MKFLVFLILLCIATNAHAASLWNQASVAAGLQERWLTNSALPKDDTSQLEAIGNAALTLTPHVSVTGGLAYGFSDAYVRGQVDARITATDVNDPGFNVWMGAGRYFSKHQSDGLDEWAAKAGVGWKPVLRYPFIVGLSAAYGLDSGRRQVTVSAVYPFKLGGSR